MLIEAATVRGRGLQPYVNRGCNRKYGQRTEAREVRGHYVMHSVMQCVMQYVMQCVMECAAQHVTQYARR